MTYQLTLTATSTAQADGVSVNTATATLMQDNIYVSGQNIIFRVTGSAKFTNSQQQITSITGATGTASVAFSDTVAEAVTIIAVVATDASAMGTAQSIFAEESQGDDELTLSVVVNNAKANGVDKNQLQALVQSKTTLLPVSGITCSFSAPAGNAKFDNGGKTYITTTDNSGVCNAYLTDTIAESIPVTVTIPPSQTQIQTVTFTAGDVLRITEVSTLNNKQFSPNRPSTAWVGAQFQILIRGGSGVIDWSVNNAGLSVHTLLRDGVILEFTGVAEVNQLYTVTGKDKKSGEIVTYSFTLNDYYVSFGSVQFIEGLLASGDSNYLPSANQLHTLYAQWGTMSQYKGWTEKTTTYWTSEFNVLTVSKLVDITTNEESTVFANLLQEYGFAKLSIGTN